MRSTHLAASGFCVVLALLARASADEPMTVEAKITSVGLFKNGLAAVRRSVSFPGDGVYEIADVPDAVHGTFWIESEAKVEALVTTRETQEPFDGRWNGELARDLAGREVTIHFREHDIPPVSGRVAAYGDKDGDRSWSREFEQPVPVYRWWNRSVQTTPAQPPVRYLVLQSKEGQSLIDPSMIGYVQVTDPRPNVRRVKPVLRLTVREAGKGGDVTIQYLTKGIGWAPSYRLDLKDSKRLSLAQSAVIRNELEDLKDVEVFLISGYPNVEFGNVLSPLSPKTTWAAFFTELSQRFAPPSGGVGQIADNFVSSLPEAVPTDAEIVGANEGLDVYYRSIGRRSLAEGDSLLIPVIEAGADYERIVEWMIPDTRMANGQIVDDYRRESDPEKYDESAWDAVRFRNPLEFPMTTGPAMVTAGGRFDGQRLSTWVNPGEQTSVRINKALSVRTRAVEVEEEGKRVETTIWWKKCYKATVRGELEMTNHRKEAVRMVVRRRFSGGLLEADAEPTTKLLEEGVTMLNPRNELTWTIDIPPGETRKLGYRYTLNVPD